MKRQTLTRAVLLILDAISEYMEETSGEWLCITWSKIKRKIKVKNIPEEQDLLVAWRLILCPMLRECADMTSKSRVLKFYIRKDRLETLLRELKSTILSQVERAKHVY